LALTLLQDQLQSATQYWRFVLGAILAAMVIFFPAVSRHCRGFGGLLGTQGGPRGTSPPLDRGVSKHCGPFRALDDVTVSVADREFVSIVGPNGAARPRSSTC
jgi:hypothetical protein